MKSSNTENTEFAERTERNFVVFGVYFGLERSFSSVFSVTSVFSVPRLFS